MARRILFKENGLGTQSISVGYKLIGMTNGTLSVLGTSSNPKSVDGPQSFISIENGQNIFDEDLGGGIRVGYNPKRVSDLDFTDGEYTLIWIESGTWNSIKLPTTFGKSLSAIAILSIPLNLETIKFKPSDYPNLGFARGSYFELVEDVIDLPHCEGFAFGGSKLSKPFIKTPENLTIKPYYNNTIVLFSQQMKSVTFDFSSFTFSSIYNNTIPSVISYSINTVLNGYNLENITLSNLSDYSDMTNGSLIFTFEGCPLTTESQDDILLKLDTAFPSFNGSINISSIQPSYQSYQDLPKSLFISDSFVVGDFYYIEALNSGDEFSNIGYVSDGSVFQAIDTTPNNWTNKTIVRRVGFVSGQVYYIESLNGEDYFSNIGFTGNGVTFSATGDYPTTWINNTIVYADYGAITEANFYFANDIPEDGRYLTKEIDITILGGTISSIELLHLNGGVFGEVCYPGYIGVYSGQNFQKKDNMGRPIWIGSDATCGTGLIHDLTYVVTKVTKSKTPTDITSNINYQSLISKGWSVTINRIKF